ncbi:MAG: histidine phosphatase family protein [Proteobacteria bacterium]|nr:histidine phosphatase family protein [Pseudomonadota bacterium]
MKLQIIRHCTTELNERSILQGRLDVPIKPPNSKIDFSIKKYLLDYFDGNLPDIILTSQLKRTQETALYLGFDKFQIENLLDELDFGEFEGRQRTDFLKLHQEAWMTNPASLILGEPVSSLANRVKRFMVKYENCRYVLAFGHGAWMRCFLSLVQNDFQLKKMNQQKLNNLEMIRVQLVNQAVQCVQVVPLSDK